MFKSLKSWWEVEGARICIQEEASSKEHREWIARIWTPDTIHDSTLVMSVPYSTKKDMQALKKALKASKMRYKVTEHKIEFNGDYIV